MIRPQDKKSTERKTPGAEPRSDLVHLQRATEKEVRPDPRDQRFEQLAKGERARGSPDQLEPLERREQRRLIRGEKRRPAIVERIPEWEMAGVQRARGDLAERLELQHRVGDDPITRSIESCRRCCAARQIDAAPKRLERQQHSIAKQRRPIEETLRQHEAGEQQQWTEPTRTHRARKIACKTHRWRGSS
jgi:hypothetical protein